MDQLHAQAWTVTGNVPDTPVPKRTRHRPEAAARVARSQENRSLRPATEQGMEGMSAGSFWPMVARYDDGGAGGRHRACGKDGVHLREPILALASSLPESRAAGAGGRCHVSFVS